MSTNLTHWIGLYLNSDVTYFDSFRVEYFRKEIKKFIENSHNKYLSSASKWFQMCGYYYNRFIDFQFKVKSLLDYTNLLSLNRHENNKIKLKYFQ